MKKRCFLLIAGVLLIALLAGVLTACNDFKWGPINGADAGADVISNGGFVVRQGKHLYFINGFDSSSSVDNTFGAPFKNSIMRATIKDDGSIDESSYAVVVPKQIYSTSSKSGFAIFNGWIYYATPNNDKDRTGTPSTTNMDFMRTSLDGSITQRIITVGSRSMDYFFTPSRIVTYSNNTLTSIDFTAMKAGKSQKDGKGVTTSTLASGVTSVVYKYDPVYSASQGESVSDYILYTKGQEGAKSYKYSNLLCAVKADGSGYKVVADAEKFGGEYKITLLDAVVESDDLITIYYTKSAESTGAVVGVYCNKLDKSMTFNPETEKVLTLRAQSTIIPVSYDMGALVVDKDDSKIYYLDGASSSDDLYSEGKLVIGRTDVKVQYISNENGVYYVYYINSSKPDKLFKINLIAESGSFMNETIVAKDITMKSDWISPEFIKDEYGLFFYYFDTDEYGYTHRVNISSFDGVKPIENGALVGVMTEAYRAEKQKAEENK